MRMKPSHEPNHNNYFEGVIQVRNHTDKQLSLIEKIIYEDGARISKRKKIKTGLDLYVTRQKSIQKVERNIRKQGALTKISRHLFTQDRHTGKRVYRLNLLVRFPDYNIGDCLAINGKLFMVTALGKKASCIDLGTGKKKTINTAKSDFEVVRPLKTTVTKVNPRLEVMDPSTYQSEECADPIGISPKLGQKVKVAYLGKFYLLSK